MKILQAHKYYYHRDGASNYMLQLSDSLREAGHQVIPFSMQGPNNLPTPYSRFFVSEMDISDPRRIGMRQKMRYALRMLYSPEAKRNIQKVLSLEKIDIVHLHNIYHHISPSILGAIKKRGIPIVMTLHDYKLIAPNYSLFHHGAVHEEDATGWYGTCVKNKCMKDSKMQSRMVRWEMIFHHKIMKFYEHYVDRFIAPSQFMMDLCIKHGMPKKKFVHIPHPIDARTFTPTRGGGEAVAFVGRLSEEKGIDTLIQAAARLPQIPFWIIGTGPQEKQLRDVVKKRKMHHVTFTGFQTGEQLTSLMKKVRVFVVPSVWYENYPLSILEPKAMAKVVIGSDIGGIPELLPKSLLVPAGNAPALADAIAQWYDAPPAVRTDMGAQLRAEVLEQNSPELHLNRIEQLYKMFVS